jgi:hypothetical protein
MSDKRPDERDIDEILASIDEMLSQKQPYTLQDDERKDSVTEAVKASEDTLGLSSSVDLPELSEFDQVDIDEFLSLGMSEDQPKAEHKTEKNIEEAHKVEAQTDTVHDMDNQAMLDLDQEIDEEIDFTLDEADLPDFDDTDSVNQEKNVDKQETQAPEISDGNDIPLSPEKTQEPADTNTVDDVLHDNVIEESLAENNLSKNDFIEGVLDEPTLDDNDGLGEDSLNENHLDDNNPDETELLHDEHQDDEPVIEDSMPRHRILLTEELLEPSAQEALPLWIEQASDDKETTEENSTIGKHKTATQQESKADKLEADTKETETLETVESKEEETKPEQHVSNADVPTNKSEAESASPAVADKVNAETNAFGDEASDLPKDDATVFDLDEDIGVDTVYKLETLIAPSEDDLDNHTELVEVMMEEVLQEDNEQPQDLEEQETTETEKVFLSDDELQEMVQAVSEDVSQQINDHLQTWLPGLISIAIKNHMKDLNNKDLNNKD